jgi:hypothetical protein
MNETSLNSEMLVQMQGEVIDLVTAWADRGIPPDEAAMVLAANTHMILMELNFTLGQIVSVLAAHWRKSNGKL